MPLPLRTARQAGHNILYHYRKFNAEHLADLLTRSRIYCSVPSKLNDPWDCRPWIDPSPLLNDPKELERYFEWLHSNADPPPADDLRRAHDEHMRNNPEALRQSLAGLSRSIARVIAERRILCLTPHNDNILMWSHYADNHRGICLVFSTDHELFGEAKEVLYRATYQTVSANLLTPDNVISAVFTKADVWSYENEFRVMGIPEAPGAAIQLDGNYLSLGTALTGIIMGCEADHKTILKFLRGYAPELPIFHAVRADNQYRLEIARFSADEITT